MITVNTKLLAEAVIEADAFKMPDMSGGTEYLYHSVYNKLSRNINVRLSDIDFNAFEQDDIDSLNDLHSDVFERNQYAADGIMTTLRKVMPVCKAVGYV